jgi:hypothetical protein
VIHEKFRTAWKIRLAEVTGFEKTTPAFSGIVRFGRNLCNSLSRWAADQDAIWWWIVTELFEHEKICR